MPDVGTCAGSSGLLNVYDSLDTFAVMVPALVLVMPRIASGPRTVMLCCTCGAGRTDPPLPGWFASMMHVPAAV